MKTGKRNIDDPAYGRFLLCGLRALLDNSQDMIFIKNTDLVYIAASHSFARMVGKKCGEDLEGKTDFDIFEHDLAQKYTDDDRGVLSSGACIEDDIEPLPARDGRKSYSSTSKYAVRDEAGTIIGLYGVARDVTEMMEWEAERESSRMSREMFHSVLEADLTLNRMLRSEGSDWVEQLGVAGITPFTAAVGLACGFIDPDYLAEFQRYYLLEKLKADYAGGRDEISHITRMRFNGSGYRWVEFKSRIYHSRVSDTLRITTFVTDVDEDVRHWQQLQKRATTDMLTGLRNRSSVLDSIAACLEANGGGEQHALLFIDLDGFKQINDRWGHSLGDKILVKTSNRLKKVFSGSDIVGRIGGDEFLVFLRYAPSRQSVEEQARAALEPLHYRQTECDADIHVTCSIGAAFCSGGDITVDRLCERADKAMYQAKALGRNRLFFYDDLE